MTSTKTRALDAAIDLVGSQGLRALTHARVDERAGLPKGSTSNHFRTRQALLSGVVDRLVELDTPANGAGFLPASAEEFIEALCQLFDHLTRVNRIPTTARLVLFMEGSHDISLREDLSRGREVLELCSWLLWPDWVPAIRRPLPRRLPPASRASCFTGSRGTTRLTHARLSNLW